MRRWHAARCRRTTGLLATAPEWAVTSTVRMRSPTSAPLSRTRPGGISNRSPVRSRSIAASSAKSQWASKAASVTARYIAPVSR